MQHFKRRKHSNYTELRQIRMTNQAAIIEALSKLLRETAANSACKPQGVDLAYLYTGIRGAFFGGFEFRTSVFFGVLLTAAVFFGVVR